MSDKKNVELTVEGMTCSNCAKTVQKSLEKQGLQQVQVDFMSGAVTFENVADEEISKAINAIDELGYKVKNHPDEKKNSYPHLRPSSGSVPYSLSPCCCTWWFHGRHCTTPLFN